MASAEKETVISSVEVENEVSESSETSSDEMENSDITNFFQKRHLMERNCNKLIDMFPNIDAIVIREICENPPFHNVDGDLLTMLINYLLNYENKINIYDLNAESYNDIEERDKILSEQLTFQEFQERERERQERESVNNKLFEKFLENDSMKTQMDILINILPDADPQSLQNFIKTNHNNINSLEEFVESKLTTNNYLKRSQYYEKLKKEANIDKYITNFQVTEFIKEFPEPFEYFENQERICINQKEALSFLRNRYNNFDENYINQVYISSKYNLSIADQNLQKANCQSSVQLNIDTNDILLLKEIAFIQNKEKIKVHLELVQKNEYEQMQLFKAQQLLLNCQCCCEDVLPNKCIECDNGHIFCQMCIIKATQHAITNGQTKIKCFTCLTECSKEISLQTLRHYLPPDVYDKFFKKFQEDEINAAKIDDLVSCPFCTFSMELGKEIKIFSCKNLECMKISCRSCKKLNHLPIKCEDVLDEHKGRLFIEEEMSDALIRKCNKCQIPFIKSYGCNKMTCSKCGSVMCYLCRKTITDYNHFDRPNGCRTNEDSERFDREQINLRRALAFQKISQESIDLKLPTI